MLIGLALMFFGYANGLFEWHLLVISSNILGICVFYSGYLSTPICRKLHLSTSVSVYGLANLVLLALRLNGLKVHEFVFDNPLTLLLAGMSIFLPLLVLYYPNRFFVQVAITWAEKYTGVTLRNNLRKIHLIGILYVPLIASSHFFYPSLLTWMVMLYVCLHCLLLAWFFIHYQGQIVIPLNKEVE